MPRPIFVWACLWRRWARKTKPKSEYKKAIELFKKRIQNDSKDSADYFYLGEAYNFLHRDEDAVRAYRQATQLKSDDEETWYQLGSSLNKLARYTEAIAAFRESAGTSAGGLPRD